MSEYHILEELKFNDLNCLIKALKKMGYQPEIHEEEVNLYGYQGDRRSQKAHIVLPKSQVGGMSNDIGFERTSAGTYNMHISEYDQKIKSFNENKLKQIYNEERIMKELTQGGKWCFESRKVSKNGEVKLYASRLW